MQLAFPATLSGHRRELVSAAAERLEGDHGSDLLGLVLTGSTALGLETDLSDIDLLVILEPHVVNGPTAPWLHTRDLEQIPITLQHLETVAAFGDSEWPYRPSYAWAPVLADFSGGRISAAIERQTRLTVEETMTIVLNRRIGDYVNLTYRALKSARDGRSFAAALDAAESVPILLDVVFGLDGLVRPYNKCLSWAVHNHPLSDWQPEDLLETIDGVRGGDPDSMRHGVRVVRQAALRFDQQHQQSMFREFFDEWSGDGYGDVLGIPATRAWTAAESTASPG